LERILHNNTPTHQHTNSLTPAFSKGEKEKVLKNPFQYLYYGAFTPAQEACIRGWKAIKEPVFIK
jgi:hypothetical protein